MILVWGYPFGGRGNNIQNILVSLDELVNIFTGYKQRNLTLKDFEDLISSFNRITELGISTWTKFLYFFDISVDCQKCEIFDLKIVESLNKKQFFELKISHWIQDVSNYLEYTNLINEIF